MEERKSKESGNTAEDQKKTNAEFVPRPGSGAKSRKWVLWVVALAVISFGAGAFLLKQMSSGKRTSKKQAQQGSQQTHRVKKAVSKLLRVQKPDWTSLSSGMEFVWVPALNMWVGKYEVTNDEYQKKDPTHDSRDHKGYRLTGGRQPVVYVNYDEACAYADWLTASDKATGKLPADHRYRVPSQDEWMILAQCEEDRGYPWGNEWPPATGQAGNYDDEIIFDTACIDGGYQDGHPVTCNVEDSGKTPWGLFGIGGNVWEATSSNSVDAVFGSWRGASWFVSSPVSLRCDYGINGGSSDRRNDYGFRLVLAGPESD